MSTVTVKYQLSDAARRRIAVATGDEPKREQELVINLAALQPEQRAVLLDARNKVDGAVKLVAIEPKSYTDDKSAWYESTLQADEIQTVESVLAHLQTRTAQIAAAEAVQAGLRAKANAEKIAEARAYLADESKHAPTMRGWPDAPNYDEIQSLTEQVNAEQEWRRTVAREKAEQEKAEQEAKKEVRHQNRLTWVDAHGSDRLKRGLAAGHDCARLYYTERAAVEYPGFVVDFGDKAAWKARACPSVAALDVLDETNDAHPEAEVEIVWMTTPPGADDDDDTEHEGVEAVVANDPNFSDWLVRAIGE